MFNLDWLERQLRSVPDIRQAADVQRTLVEFTVISIRDALARFFGSIEEVLVCGGGAHNELLMQRLHALLSPRRVHDTQVLGLHPDWVEAVAFAWLARQRLKSQPANIPAVTGAATAVVLGAVYPGFNRDA